MDTEPDFSIVTPSFNYATDVRECIESVLGQEGATFEHIIQDAGYTAMVYCNTSDAGTDFYLSQLQDYPFWLAHYTPDWTPTTFPYHYDMWQYSSSGSVDGIPGRVDLNLCLTDW